MKRERWQKIAFQKIMIEGIFKKELINKSRIEDGRKTRWGVGWVREELNGSTNKLIFSTSSLPFLMPQKLTMFLSHFFIFWLPNLQTFLITMFIYCNSTLISYFKALSLILCYNTLAPAWTIISKFIFLLYSEARLKRAL